MPQPTFRSFADDTGRTWRVSELFTGVQVRELTGGAGATGLPMPLLFVSGIDKRWVTNAPGGSRELACDELGRLLSEAREFPHWVGSFLGHFDE